MKIIITIVLFITVSAMSLTAQKNSSDKILMVLPQSGFFDNEYSIPRMIFEKNNYDVEVVSSSLRSALGMHDVVVIPDITTKKVKVEKYKAIVFPGGNGVEDFYNDTIVHQIITNAVKNNLVIGAISSSPNVLAKAGILVNINVTGTDSRILEDSGATYKGNSIEISGKIVTARNSNASYEFACSIVKMLKQKEQ